MALIEVHSSARPESLQREIISALRENRLDPKCLYLTPRQAELWQKVSLHHSPVYSNPEFRRIYADAFARVANEIRDAQRIELVGLGCGGGEKEEQLCRQLREGGRELSFSGVDVSETLVRETQMQLVEAGADYRAGLVCDLAQVEFLRSWLDRQTGAGPRLLTLFGLVPNFSPARLAIILHALLRPGDLLLASVHLVPVADGESESAAMRHLLPQYKNRETLDWLAAALQALEIESLLEPPEMVIGEIEGVPAFAGRAHWISARPFSKWGETFSPNAGHPLQLFQSLRYTPGTFLELLQGANLQGECLALTTCQQEGIWAIRKSA